MFKKPFASSYAARLTYREVKILRKLSEMEVNEFTPHIYEIILPREAFNDINMQTMGNILSKMPEDQNLNKMYYYIAKTQSGETNDSLH